MTIFIVLSSMALAICESSLWFLWAEVGQRQVARGRQLVGQVANLTFEYAGRLLQAEHSPITIGIITQP